MYRITEIFNSFNDYLKNDEELSMEIHKIVRELEKNARDIVMILQNIHSKSNVEENIYILKYCAEARDLFGNVQENYKKLAIIVPEDEYYRFNKQWSSVTQKFCFLISLIIYLEVKTLVTKETAAEILGVQNNREIGFLLDLEDFLMGLLELPNELIRFAMNSVTNGNYERPIEIAKFINELNAGFKLLNLKNNALRKRFDGLKYTVKKIEEMVYDLSIRGLKPSTDLIA